MESKSVGEVFAVVGVIVRVFSESVAEASRVRIIKEFPRPTRYGPRHGRHFAVGNGHREVP